MSETTRRVARKQSAKRRSPEPVAETPALDPGDSVEFSLTAEIKTQAGRVMWAKGGATTTVRSGETPAEAYDRTQQFVSALIEQTAKDLA